MKILVTVDDETGAVTKVQSDVSTHPLAVMGALTLAQHWLVTARDDSRIVPPGTML